MRGLSSYIIVPNKRGMDRYPQKLDRLPFKFCGPNFTQPSGLSMGAPPSQAMVGRPSGAPPNPSSSLPLLGFNNLGRFKDSEVTGWWKLFPPQNSVYPKNIHRASPHKGQCGHHASANTYSATRLGFHRESLPATAKQKLLTQGLGIHVSRALLQSLLDGLIRCLVRNHNQPPHRSNASPSLC